MAKKTELTEEVREAIFEAARAGALEAYAANTGGFKNRFAYLFRKLCFFSHDFHPLNIA